MGATGPRGSVAAGNEGGTRAGRGTRTEAGRGCGRGGRGWKRGRRGKRERGRGRGRGGEGTETERGGGRRLEGGEVGYNSKQGGNRGEKRDETSEMRAFVCTDWAALIGRYGKSEVWRHSVGEKRNFIFALKINKKLISGLLIILFFC